VGKGSFRRAHHFDRMRVLNGGPATGRFASGAFAHTHHPMESTSAAHERRVRTPKNVSRNRPDATNLNHQNANRRIFMALSCNVVCCAADSPKRGKEM
jgi:hypothetical protein